MKGRKYILLSNENIAVVMKIIDYLFSWKERYLVGLFTMQYNIESRM